MSGHVVPWCIGCGLDAHDPSLFDMDGDLIFDDVDFDIDVHVNRLGGQPQSTFDLMRIFKRNRMSIHRAMAKGHLPRPAVVGTRNDPSYWNVREIAAIVLAGGLHKGNPVAPCGTIGAYRRHVRKGERIDSLCATAATAYRRQDADRKLAHA